MMLALALTAVLAQAPSATQAELPDTAPLELERYLGTWYELARYDTFFERGCVGVTATYTRPDPASGDIVVRNQCYKKALDGDQSSVEGKAWVPDAKEPGKLKVQFFWPFSGDYWVLDVAPDYSWALVGNKKKSSCWVFSRTPSMDPALYEALMKKLVARGYEPDKLLKVEQKLK